MKESELRQTFEVKAKKAANLAAYEQQLSEMKESFGAMLRQLPNKTEVADLLVDISQTGLASGLEFELFKPQAEVPKEFYAELPISIRVKGTYHEFGNFVSGVAALPRIVTVHDINIEPDKDQDGELTMDILAKTYRYMDDDEQQAAANQGPANKGGAK
jgi:type IV pilus assembly protein PilO